jgi:hypothetical protein
MVVLAASLWGAAHGASIVPKAKQPSQYLPGEDVTELAMRDSASRRPDRSPAEDTLRGRIPERMEGDSARGPRSRASETREPDSLGGSGSGPTRPGKPSRPTSPREPPSIPEGGRGGSPRPTTPGAPGP